MTDQMAASEAAKNEKVWLQFAAWKVYKCSSVRVFACVCVCVREFCGCAAHQDERLGGCGGELDGDEDHDDEGDEQNDDRVTTCAGRNSESLRAEALRQPARRRQLDSLSLSLSFACERDLILFLLSSLYSHLN